MIFSIIAALALIIGIVALVFSFISLTVCIGLKNSTHKIQFIDPASQEFTSFGEDTKKNMAKSDDTLESIQ